MAECSRPSFAPKFGEKGEGQESTFPITCHIFSRIKENESSLLGKFPFSGVTTFSTRDKNCGQGLWTVDLVWYNSQCALIIKKRTTSTKGRALSENHFWFSQSYARMKLL